MGIAGLGSGSLILGAIHIDVGVARDRGTSKVTAEGTPVTTGPNSAMDVEGAHLVVDPCSRLFIRSVLDCVLADKGIDGTEGVAIVTCGIDVLVDDTAADVGDADGSCFGRSAEGAVLKVEVIAVVGVT